MFFCRVSWHQISKVANILIFNKQKMPVSIKRSSFFIELTLKRFAKIVASRQTQQLIIAKKV